MGKRYVDSITFEEIYDHPILEIGSSYSTLKTEIRIWLNENFGTNWEFTFSGNDYQLWFRTEAHKTWFLIRWLTS